MLRVLTIAEHLMEKKVRLVSIRERIDIGDANGKLMFQILCSFAEFEGRVIVNRVKTGLAAARARGVKLGAPRHDSKPAGVKALNYAIILKRKGGSMRAIQERLREDLSFNISIGTLSNYFKNHPKLREIPEV